SAPLTCRRWSRRFCRYSIASRTNRKARSSYLVPQLACSLSRTAAENCSSGTDTPMRTELLGIQREPASEFLDLVSNSRDGLIVTAREDFVDQLGDPHHLCGTHPASRERRGSHTNPAGDERRLRVVGDGVLVDRDTSETEQALGFLAGELARPEVHQHQMRVGAAGDDRQAACHK